jgi:hypothetical protein
MAIYQCYAIIKISKLKITRSLTCRFQLFKRRVFKVSKKYLVRALGVIHYDLAYDNLLTISREVGRIILVDLQGSRLVLYSDFESISPYEPHTFHEVEKGKSLLPAVDITRASDRPTTVPCVQTFKNSLL